MFGVVLWSDEKDQKAVIWCEDHGDLAFYRSADELRNCALDAGDWVEFDLSMEQNMRFAHNPRLVAEGVFPELPQTLESVAPAKISPAAPVQTYRGSAKIIPFTASRQNSFGAQKSLVSGRA